MEKKIEDDDDNYLFISRLHLSAVFCSTASTVLTSTVIYILFNSNNPIIYDIIPPKLVAKINSHIKH